MSEIRKGLGARIKRIRKELGLNQKAFGEILGVGISAVSSYESGTSVPPPEALVLIAERGEVPIDYLFTGSRTASPFISDAVSNPVTDRNHRPETEDGRSVMAMVTGVTEGTKNSGQTSSLATHGDVQQELSKEEFTLLSLFRQFSDEQKKEKLLEFAYLSALDKAKKPQEWF